MKKIENLTHEQEIRMKEKLAEWLEIGRSTTAIDREAAENAIAAIYKEIGKERPSFCWFPSPLQCMLAVSDFTLKNKNLGKNLWGNIQNNFRYNFSGNIKKNLWENLYNNINENLWWNLWNNIAENLELDLSENFEVILDYYFFAGNLWCAWEVFYDFCNEIGVPCSQEDRHQLDLWLNQSRNCHFWWPLEGIVFLSERPASLMVDDKGRLHCENGASLRYHDGHALYNWHGVRVPQWVITEPQTITFEKIFAEENAEIRRMMMERYGFYKFVAD